MKIAVISRYFPSSAEPWQGRSAYETIRALTRNEPSADVRVFFPNSVYPRWLKPRSRIYNQLDPAFKLPDVAVDYFNYPALPLLSRPWNGSIVARLLLEPIRHFAPDILFSILIYPDGYAAMKIGRALNVPVVAMTIGSDVHSIGDRISAMHTRTALRGVDYTLAVSDDLRRRAVALGAPASKTRALLNGCDLSVFHPAGKLEARQQLGLNPIAETVVFIGRMDIKKGLRELVEASVKLHESRRDLHVYMVGAGPDRGVIEAAIAAAGAQAYLHPMPACRFDEVAVWMTAADLVTLPSYMEGCPNVVLEALACGRPVVATHVGGIPEIVSESCGYLVPPRDAAALSKALAATLDRPWDPATIAAQGGRSWDQVGAELYQTFEEVIAAPLLR